jgi:hypothetical protein
MNKIQNFLENLKHKNEEDRHSFAIFISSILTVFVGFLVLLSWYLEYYDLPIQSSLLTKIVDFFQK